MFGRVRSARALFASIAVVGELLACGNDSSGPTAAAGDAATTSDAHDSEVNEASASSDGAQHHDGGGADASDGASTSKDGAGDGPRIEAAVADGAGDTGSFVDASGDSGCGAGAGGSSSPYDRLILCDHPVAYWAVDMPPASEPDLTGNGHTGMYQGGTPSVVTMPNGDHAADFNGSSEYVSVASSASFSIPTTGELTWEGWIRPDVLQFPHNDGMSGYVDWLGKCDSYAPTCEWEARMYDTNTLETPNRCNRLSAYVFNPSAGFGSAADWQPQCGLLQAGTWYHVVGEYTTKTQPADCPSAPQYPGSIDVWVDGVPWDQASHNPTGCMSQYNIAPMANGSTLTIGTMAADTWFQGAIGKVAIYGYRLTQAQITSHYQAMTGKLPMGSCADMCTL
jgi:hypothetical protein